MPVATSPRPVLLLVAATACWGCGTVLSKQTLDRGVAPLTLLVVELAASVALLTPALAMTGGRPTRSARSVGLAALGVLNPGLAYALGLLGLVTVSASTAVLMWAIEPALILLLAVPVLRERIAAPTAAALLVAVAGVFLVVYRPGVAGDAVGIALTGAAVTACAAYTVLTRRLLLDDGSVAVVLTQQVAALGLAGGLVSVAGVTGLAEPGLPPDAATWALGLASGTVYYGLAFVFFVGGLRDVPAFTGAGFLPLVPVFGLAAGYLTGDRLDGRQWLGAGLVVVAVAVAALLHLARERATARLSRGRP